MRGSFSKGVEAPLVGTQRTALAKGEGGKKIEAIEKKRGGWPGRQVRDEMGAPRVGFTRGSFDSDVPCFYPVTGSIATVKIKPPGVERSCEET